MIRPPSSILAAQPFTDAAPPLQSHPRHHPCEVNGEPVTQPLPPLFETPTFKPINGRWHVARLCIRCRGKIWTCVEDAPIETKARPVCGRCES